MSLALTSSPSPTEAQVPPLPPSYYQATYPASMRAGNHPGCCPPLRMSLISFDVAGLPDLVPGLFPATALQYHWSGFDTLRTLGRQPEPTSCLLGDWRALRPSEGTELEPGTRHHLISWDYREVGLSDQHPRTGKAVRRRHGFGRRAGIRKVWVHTRAARLASWAHSSNAPMSGASSVPSVKWRE